MTTYRNPRFERMITDFCRKRVTQVLPPKETEQLERYLVALHRAGGPVPAQGRGVNWRRVSQGCGIEHEVLLAANSQLRPIFAALAADLAKPAPRKPVRPKPRKAPAEWTPPATPRATIVELKPRQPSPKLAQENAGIRSSFRLTLNDKMRERGDTTLDLHRLLDRAGEQVEPSTLRSWITGRKAPATADSFRLLGLIEAHYELPAGCLKEGLPHRGRALKGHALASISASERRRLAWHLPDDFGDRSVAEQEAILEWVRTRVIAGATDYRRFQAAAMKHRYAVKFPEHRSVESSDEEEDRTPDRDPELARACRVAPRELGQEMAQLLAFKTSTLTAPGYQRRGVWGEETASQKVEHLGLLFGALAASVNGPVRGRGVPLSDLSFGVLVFPAVWDWYVQWRERRRGFYTAWEVDMLSVAVALSASPAGWMAQTPRLAERLRPLPGLVSKEDVAEAQRDWPSACARLHQHCLQRAKEVQRVARVHRDPFEPILPVLEADSPVGEYRKIADEIVRLMPDERRYPKAVAESVRSLLMIRLGLHLGLRQKNLRQLMLCPRGRAPTSERRLTDLKRGELRWSDRHGGWEVFIPAVAFKNAHSSFFGGSPFRLVLPDLGGLYGYLGTYISRHRGLLLGAAVDPETFFIKTVKVSSAEAAYNQTTFYEAWRLTIQRYGVFNPYTGRGAIPNLLPHGPHNVRDVLATHVLKQTGSFEQASYAIQDTPDVVAKHYGRFLAQDKAALAAKVLNQVWAA